MTDSDSCAHCPTPDRCHSEGDCRATWDSHTAARVRDTARTHAIRRPCPDCHADTGQPCRNLHTGEPLHRQPAHLARLRATDTTPEPTR